LEKKQAQKKPTLRLRTETLHRLDDSQLKEVAGRGRLRVPGGYAGDTTPSDDTTADTTTG
jgi:hypothetical protein